MQGMWESRVWSLGWEDPLEKGILQYSRLEDPMDRGAWWATVHGVAESDSTEAVHLAQVGHREEWAAPRTYSQEPPPNPAPPSPGQGVLSHCEVSILCLYHIPCCYPSRPCANPSHICRVGIEEEDSIPKPRASANLRLSSRNWNN